jgi:hypothetical protein
MGPVLHLDSASEQRHIMDPARPQDWRELCKAAANELDPNKLMALVAEINAVLEEFEKKRTGAIEKDARQVLSQVSVTA